MCWQLCAMFSFPPNWQLKKLDSIFYQLQYCSYIISHSQGCQFLSSNLEKDSFSGKMMTCEPCIHISHLSLLSFPERKVFSYVPCQREKNRGLLLVVNLWQNTVSKVSPSLYSGFTGKSQTSTAHCLFYSSLPGSLLSQLHGSLSLETGTSTLDIPLRLKALWPSSARL